jgi:hypothetical protein
MLSSNAELQRDLIEPVKVIESYFTFYNDKNSEGVLSTLTPIKATRYFGFEYLVYIRVNDIQKEENDRLFKNFLNGRGKTNNTKANNIRFYVVTYEAKYLRDDIGLEKSGKHTRRFILVRKDEISKWTIDGISYDLMKTNNYEVHEDSNSNCINDLIDKSLKIQYKVDNIALTDVFTDEFIKKIPVASNFYKQDLKPYKIISTNLDAVKDISINNQVVYVRINDSKGDYIQVMHFVKKDGKFLISEIEYDI